jgi:hypothetical protein
MKKVKKQIPTASMPDRTNVKNKQIKIMIELKKVK